MPKTPCVSLIFILYLFGMKFAVTGKQQLMGVMNESDRRQRQKAAFKNSGGNGYKTYH